jgi:hypothetical protein
VVSMDTRYGKAQVVPYANQFRRCVVRYFLYLRAKIVAGRRMLMFNNKGEEYDYTYIDPGAALKRLLALAQRNPLLPTRDQCLALTDAQCRRIQDVLDPDGMRYQKYWESNHQPELIRLYMTGMSFPQIKSEMTPKLDWS